MGFRANWWDRLSRHNIAMIVAVVALVGLVGLQFNTWQSDDSSSSGGTDHYQMLPSGEVWG